MGLSDKLLNDFESLPDEKKQQVIDFVEYLKYKDQLETDDIMKQVVKENSKAFEELAK